MKYSEAKDFYEKFFLKLWKVGDYKELESHFHADFRTYYNDHEFSLANILERVSYSQKRYQDISQVLIDIQKVDSSTFMLLSKITSIDKHTQNKVEFYSANLDKFKSKKLYKSWLLSTIDLGIAQSQESFEKEDRTLLRVQKEKLLDAVRLRRKNLKSASNISLTSKEIDCLLLYVSGMSAKEIGEKQNVSYRTVEKHLESVRSKLKVQTKDQLKKILNSNQILD